MYTTIPKNEAIDYLVNKCYMEFPELIEGLTEEEIRNRLNQNILLIIGIDKNVQQGAVGGYNTQSKVLKVKRNR